MILSGSNVAAVHDVADNCMTTATDLAPRGWQETAKGTVEISSALLTIACIIESGYMTTNKLMIVRPGHDNACVSTNFFGWRCCRKGAGWRPECIQARLLATLQVSPVSPAAIPFLRDPALREQGNRGEGSTSSAAGG